MNTETIHDGNIEVEDEQANVYIKAKGTKKGKMKKPVKVIKFWFYIFHGLGHFNWHLFKNMLQIKGSVPLRKAWPELSD